MFITLHINLKILPSLISAPHTLDYRVYTDTIDKPLMLHTQTLHLPCLSTRTPELRTQPWMERTNNQGFPEERRGKGFSSGSSVSKKNTSASFSRQVKNNSLKHRRHHLGMEIRITENGEGVLYPG